MISFYSHALFFQKQKKIKDFETNLKSFANPLLKNSTKLFCAYEIAKRSFNFKDAGEDLLYKTAFSSVEELSFLSKGFIKIPYQEYAYSIPQAFLEPVCVKNINFDVFDKFSFSFLDFSLFYKDNELFFVLDGEIFISVYYPQNTTVLFAGIDSNHFLNIIFDINSKQYFYKTHLSYDFYEYDFNNIITTFIENTEYVNFCELPGLDFDKTKFFSSDYSGLYFCNENKTFSKLPFYKKFYFVNDGYIYRNILPSELLGLAPEKIIKVEHLYFYDLIAFLGLNELKDELNLTSYQIEYLKKINFEFGNHFNGFQNFFNLGSPTVTILNDYVPENIDFINSYNSSFGDVGVFRPTNIFFDANFPNFSFAVFWLDDDCPYTKVRLFKYLKTSGYVFNPNDNKMIGANGGAYYTYYYKCSGSIPNTGSFSLSFSNSPSGDAYGQKAVTIEPNTDYYLLLEIAPDSPLIPNVVILLNEGIAGFASIGCPIPEKGIRYKFMFNSSNKSICSARIQGFTGSYKFNFFCVVKKSELTETAVGEIGFQLSFLDYENSEVFKLNSDSPSDIFQLDLINKQSQGQLPLLKFQIINNGEIGLNTLCETVEYFSLNRKIKGFSVGYLKSDYQNFNGYISCKESINTFAIQQIDFLDKYSSKYFCCTGLVCELNNLEELDVPYPPLSYKKTEAILFSVFRKFYEDLEKSNILVNKYVSATSSNFVHLENDYFKIIGNLKDVFGECSISISYNSDEDCVCYLQTPGKIYSSNVYFFNGVCYFKNLKIYKKFVKNSSPLKHKFNLSLKKSEYHMLEKEINKNDFASTYNLDTENFELSAFSEVVPTTASPQIVFKDSDLYIKYSDEKFEKLGIISNGNYSSLLETLSKNIYSIVDKREEKTISLTLEKTETPAFTVSKNSFSFKFADFQV